MSVESLRSWSRPHPESAILLSTSLMVNRRVVIPMSILTYHPPWQDQAESGNKSMKIPTDFTDEPNTKMPISMSTAEKQTAGKLGDSGAKDFPSSCIYDYHNNNDFQPSLWNFTWGLWTPVPNHHSSDGDGHLLQSHKLMKREHDASSEHDEMQPPILPNRSSCSSCSLSLIKMIGKIQMKMIWMIATVPKLCQWWGRWWWWPKVPRYWTWVPGEW